jgi:hypothetical protein
MLARCALGELVHQVRHFGIFPYLEGVEAVRRLGAQIEHQLFHGSVLIMSCA